jgi:hypothetical protein
MIFFVRAEVPIGLTKFTDLLPLECVSVFLWRPNRPLSTLGRRS